MLLARLTTLQVAIKNPSAVRLESEQAPRELGPCEYPHTSWRNALHRYACVPESPPDDAYRCVAKVNVPSNART